MKNHELEDFYRSVFPDDYEHYEEGCQMFSDIKLFENLIPRLQKAKFNFVVSISPNGFINDKMTGKILPMLRSEDECIKVAMILRLLRKLCSVAADMAQVHKLAHFLTYYFDLTMEEVHGTFIGCSQACGEFMDTYNTYVKSLAPPKDLPKCA